MAIYHFSVNVGKKGRGRAGPHAAYIARVGRYAVILQKGEALEASGFGNMPSWAGKNCLRFWKASDTNERANGSTYREYEFALPRELSPAQRKKLVETFIAREIGTSFAYQYAIHAKQAADGDTQPHCHLMFSERKLDGIERGPQLFFRRANRKEPGKGGCPKASRPTKEEERKAELRSLRERWAICYNEALREAGSEERVHAGTLRDQGIEREPESHLGPKLWQTPMKDEVLEARRIRQKINEAGNAILALDGEISVLAVILQRDRGYFVRLEQQIREEMRQTDEQKSLEAEEIQLEEQQALFLDWIKGIGLDNSPLPGEESRLFRDSPLVLPKKPFYQLRKTYEEECGRAVIEHHNSLYMGAKAVFFKSCQELGQLNELSLSNRRRERRLSKLTGENFDSRTDQGRWEDMKGWKKVLMDAGFVKNCPEETVVTVEPYGKGWVDELLRKSEELYRKHKEAALSAYRFLRSRKQRENWERRQTVFLEEQESLAKMERDPGSRDELFSKIATRTGSLYLARAWYQDVKTERERSGGDKAEEIQHDLGLTK